jgi:uncharacterized protein YgfB (UPF0149 family)
MNPLKLPLYSHLVGEFSDVEIELSPAEFHGMACGGLSVGGKKSQLERLFLNVVPSDKAKPLIAELIKITQAQLSAPDFSFQLLLPEDEAPLNTRIDAVKEWSQGYLLSLSESNIPLKNHPEVNIKEAITDILAIAKMPPINKPSLQDENDFVDINEHLRLAVLVIFNELHHLEEPTMH